MKVFLFLFFLSFGMESAHGLEGSSLPEGNLSYQEEVHEGHGFFSSLSRSISTTWSWSKDHISPWVALTSQNLQRWGRIGSVLQWGSLLSLPLINQETWPLFLKVVTGVFVCKYGLLSASVIEEKVQTEGWSSLISLDAGKRMVKELAPHVIGDSIFVFICSQHHRLLEEIEKKDSLNHRLLEEIEKKDSLIEDKEAQTREIIEFQEKRKISNDALIAELEKECERQKALAETLEEKNKLLAKYLVLQDHYIRENFSKIQESYKKRIKELKEENSLIQDDLAQEIQKRRKLESRKLIPESDFDFTIRSFINLKRTVENLKKDVRFLRNQNKLLSGKNKELDENNQINEQIILLLEEKNKRVNKENS